MIFLRINLTKHRTSVTSLIFDILPYVYLNANRMLLLWTYFPTFVDLFPTPCKWTLFPSWRYLRGSFFQPWTFLAAAMFVGDSTTASTSLAGASAVDRDYSTFWL